MATKTLYVNGQGFYGAWEHAGADTEWEAVQSDDADSSFARETAVNETSSYALDNTGFSGSESISKVTIYYKVRKEAASAVGMNRAVRIGGTNYPQGNNTVDQQSYSTVSVEMTASPVTSLPWTYSEIDGMEIVIQHAGADTRAIRLTYVYAVVEYTEGGAAPLASHHFRMRRA